MPDGQYFYGTVCNVIFAARFIFFLFAFVEFSAIVGLVVAAFRQRSEIAEKAIPTSRAPTSIRTVLTLVLIVLTLSFLHLELYASAFDYQHCTQWSGSRRLRGYPALAASSVLYGIGSSILIACCVIGLRRYFARTRSA